MISSVVTREFGLLACDSSVYDTKQSRTAFEFKKLYFNGNYWMTFLGTAAYFAKLDKSKLEGDVPTIVLYLKSYLKDMKPEVEKVLKSEIEDPDENKPNLCLFVLGVHKKLPTLIQFNSYANFEPKYLFSENGPKFATVFYGDDNPEKKKLFVESKEYMEKKSRKFSKKGLNLSPGILGEVLTRGIYKKAEDEMAMKPFKKYAGGVVNVAGIWNTGVMFTLSGIQQI